MAREAVTRSAVGAWIDSSAPWAGWSRPRRTCPMACRSTSRRRRRGSPLFHVPGRLPVGLERRRQVRDAGEALQQREDVGAPPAQHLGQDVLWARYCRHGEILEVAPNGTPGDLGLRPRSSSSVLRSVESGNRQGRCWCWSLSHQRLPAVSCAHVLRPQLVDRPGGLRWHVRHAVCLYSTPPRGLPRRSSLEELVHRSPTSRTDRRGDRLRSHGRYGLHWYGGGLVQGPLLQAQRAVLVGDRMDRARG
jgi:hypothetical protein